MTQMDKALRRLLIRAGGYDLLQAMMGAGRVRRFLACDHIRAERGMKVLDIGCGTGAILNFLPEVDYLGFDMNQGYVDAAAKRYGPRNRFICANVNEFPLEAQGPFDRILVLGLLHHLDDLEAGRMLLLAQTLLKPEGILVTLDSCYTEPQSKVARFLIDRDRGRNTRTEPEYLGLARSVFPSVESFLHEDLLRVPYTHVVMRCGLAPNPGR